MAFAIEDLVVSPGINAGSPFALGDVLYVAQVSPAIAASTPVIQINTATSPQQVQIGPFATIPGATVIGSGAVVPTGGAGNEVVIGTNASTGLDTQDSIAIGHGATTGILNSANGGVALGSGPRSGAPARMRGEASQSGRRPPRTTAWRSGPQPSVSWDKSRSGPGH